MTETKIIELVIVADHSEVSSPGPACPPLPPPAPACPRRLSRPPLNPQVQRYPDLQHLVNRTLEVALLLDTVSVRLSGTLTAPTPAMGTPVLSPGSFTVLPALERACGAGGPGGLDPARPDRDEPRPRCHVAQLPPLAPGQPAASFAPRQCPAGDVRAPGCQRGGSALAWPISHPSSLPEAPKLWPPWPWGVTLISVPQCYFILWARGGHGHPELHLLSRLLRRCEHGELLPSLPRSPGGALPSRGTIHSLNPHRVGTEGSGASWPLLTGHLTKWPAHQCTALA